MSYCRFTFFFVLAVFVTPAIAWEVDNITCRGRDIPDATNALNAETNRRLQLGLEMIESGGTMMNARQRARKLNEIRVRGFDPRNATPEGRTLAPPSMTECSEEQLISVLEMTVASPWSDNLETWAQYSSQVQRCTPSNDESIYSVLSFKEAPMIASAGINGVISVNGSKIGVDKLSHFMTEGLTYMRVSGGGADLKEALAEGVRQEEGGFGWKATGVKSYADMAANYKGMLFWQRLTKGENPYFKCENGRWSQVRQFDWRDYVDDSLDESVNCNEYRSRDIGARMDREAAKRWAEAGIESRKCPASPEACQDIVAKIKPPEALIAVVHPRCLKAARVAAPTEGKSDGSKFIQRGKR